MEYTIFIIFVVTALFLAGSPAIRSYEPSRKGRLREICRLVRRDAQNDCKGGYPMKVYRIVLLFFFLLPLAWDNMADALQNPLLSFYQDAGKQHLDRPAPRREAFPKRRTPPFKAGSFTCHHIDIIYNWFFAAIYDSREVSCDAFGRHQRSI